MIITSISLPAPLANIWRRHKREILRLAERFLRVKMRLQVRRRVTRTYNHVSGGYAIVSTRFTETEYDAFHYLAASLRVSVSSLIYQLIKLWLKPARRNSIGIFCANYSINDVVWNHAAGILEESLTFWRRNSKLPQAIPIEALGKP